MLLTQEGGNGDLRVPYIGFADESEEYVAEGISNYNALQAHIEKRLSHGLSLGVSYTYSRSMDEQSALGLFYNGNNPLNLKSAYGLSDFDRPNVFNIDYHYELPKFASGNSLKARCHQRLGRPRCRNRSKRAALQRRRLFRRRGQHLLQHLRRNHQPHRSVGSGLHGQERTHRHQRRESRLPRSELVPASRCRCSRRARSTGPFPAGDTFETNFTTGQRNIFRQPWQKRADISIVKLTKLTERFALRYSFDVYNLTNTPSFDIPIDNVTQNWPSSSILSRARPAVPGPTRLPATNNTAGPFATDRQFLQLPKRSRADNQDDWQLAAGSNVAGADLLT